jgi:hypothetical protein
MYAILTAFLLNGIGGIGTPAPDFSLPDIAGKPHSLREYRGKATVLVFTSTQCSITNAYADRLKSIVSDYSPRGVTDRSQFEFRRGSRSDTRSMEERFAG